MNYRYRADEEMKDSGVAWLDVIPKSWIRNKLKRELKFSVGSTPSTSNKSFFEGENIWITIGDLNGKYCSESKTKLTEEALKSANMKKVPRGSLLYSFKLSVGQVAFTEKDLYTNEAIASFYPNNNSNLNFWYYALGNYLIENSNENIYGAKLLNQELINNANIFIPSEKEQQKIAKFLDEKTSEFDSIISKKETLIEKLEEAKKSLISEVVTGKVKVVKSSDGYELVKRKKEEMKDSGVEWLGDIPKEWDIKRLRFLGTLQNGISKSSDEFGFGYPFVSYGDVYKNIELPKEVKGLVNSNVQDRNIYSVKEGDVLFTRTSETVEEIGFASTCLEGITDATFAGFLIRFRPNSNRLYKGFSKYYFRCDLNRKFFVKEMNLVTRASLSQNLLNNLSVVLPAYEEQKEIYLALELKVNGINNGINKIRYQIEKLKEAKQSLISEAVTGKIEIL